jgi:hypothetical protein
MKNVIYICLFIGLNSFADTDVFFEPRTVTKEQIKVKEEVIKEVKSSKSYLELSECNKRKDNDECLKTFLSPSFIEGLATSGETKICADADDCLNYKSTEIMAAVRVYIRLFMTTIESNKHQNVSVRSKTYPVLSKDLKTFPKGSEVWMVPSKTDRHVEMFEPSFVIEIKPDSLKFTYFSDGNGC